MRSGWCLIEILTFASINREVVAGFSSVLSPPELQGSPRPFTRTKLFEAGS